MIRVFSAGLRFIGQMHMIRSIADYRRVVRLWISFTNQMAQSISKSGNTFKSTILFPSSCLLTVCLNTRLLKGHRIHYSGHPNSR